LVSKATITNSSKNTPLEPPNSQSSKNQQESMMNEERDLRHHCEVSNNLKTEVLRVRQQQNQAINESRPPTNTTKWVIQTPIDRNLLPTSRLPASMKLMRKDIWPPFKDGIGNWNLDVNGLSKFISVEAKTPKQVDDEDESDLAEYSKWKDWKSNDSKEKLILFYNVDKSLVGLIRGKKSAKGMMDSLDQRYEGSWVSCN